MIEVQDIIQNLKEAKCLVSESVKDTSPQISQFSVDHRTLDEDCAFIAIKGVHFDSHQMIHNLGVRVPLLIVECEQTFKSIKEPCLLVRNSREAWAHLEALKAGHPEKNLKIWAITGTNGKTSSAWIGHSLLQLMGLKALSIGTIGIFEGEDYISTQHTTPDPPLLFQSLAKAKARGCTHVIMEVSSHALAQKKLGPIRFEGSLFTSFSRDHLDFHPTMRDYFLEKRSLLTDLTKPEGRRVASIAVKSYADKCQLALPSSTITYGEKASKAAIRYELKTQNIKYSEFSLAHKNDQLFRVPLFGTFIIENLLGCLILLEPLLPKNPIQFQKLLAQLKPVPGRIEGICIEGDAPYQVIVDYAHTPDALETCLKCLRPLVKKRLICVFGCGGDRDRGKRKLMGRVAAQLADISIVTSDNPRSEDPLSIIQEITSAMTESPSLIQEVDRRQAIQKAIAIMDEGDCVLIAGKGHETYQIIGDQRRDFDDREIARHYLAERK